MRCTIAISTGSDLHAPYACPFQPGCDQRRAWSLVPACSVRCDCCKAALLGTDSAVDQRVK